MVPHRRWLPVAILTSPVLPNRSSRSQADESPRTGTTKTETVYHLSHNYTPSDGMSYTWINKCLTKNRMTMIIIHSMIYCSDSTDSIIFMYIILKYHRIIIIQFVVPLHSHASVMACIINIMILGQVPNKLTDERKFSVDSLSSFSSKMYASIWKWNTFSVSVQLHNQYH